MVTIVVELPSLVISAVKEFLPIIALSTAILSIVVLSIAITTNEIDSCQDLCECYSK